MKKKNRKVVAIKFLGLEGIDYCIWSKKLGNSPFSFVGLVISSNFLILHFQNKLEIHMPYREDPNDLYFTIWPTNKRIAKKKIPMQVLYENSN